MDPKETRAKLLEFLELPAWLGVGVFWLVPKLTEAVVLCILFEADLLPSIPIVGILWFIGKVLGFSFILAEGDSSYS